MLTKVQKPPQENCSESSEKQISRAEEVDQEQGQGLKETIHSTGVQGEEREVDIPPGERVSIVVGCQAK